MTENPTAPKTISRRNITRGLAWSAPAVVAVAAAPFAAASPTPCSPATISQLWQEWVSNNEEGLTYEPSTTQAGIGTWTVTIPEHGLTRFVTLDFTDERWLELILEGEPGESFTATGEGPAPASLSEVTIEWESGGGVGYNTETDENNECVIAKYVYDRPTPCSPATISQLWQEWVSNNEEGLTYEPSTTQAGTGTWTVTRTIPEDGLTRFVTLIFTDGGRLELTLEGEPGESVTTTGEGPAPESLSEVTILWESGSGVGYNTGIDENNECVIAKYVSAPS
ncbi:hypothetical protein M3F57_14350 [Brachybacterium muris]|uniref:hypothetical protein n=1 Tax=Brachybacterium muris TaxID=219301 RepID=UPI00223C1BC0|nr:hypothetical protein [Brachybacterium muris]MCT2297286.1 hypothetical protein [Brachybacterium muris]